MNCIVTGIEGFVGGYLKKQLEADGDRVIGLPWRLLDDYNGLKEFLDQYEPFLVFNLAAYGNLHGQDDIREMYNSSVFKTLNLLNACKSLNCLGVLIVGTTSEYGTKLIPLKEDMLLAPNSYYGASKTASTILAQTWAKQEQKSIFIVRPATIIGPGDHPNHFIPTIIRSCMYQEPMKFTEESSHEYIDVRDLVRGFSVLLKNPNSKSGEIYNIGTEAKRSNREVLNMVEEITGKKANIHGDWRLRSFEIGANLQTDSAKIKSLGWVPQISLYQSIKDMILEYLK